MILIVHIHSYEYTLTFQINFIYSYSTTNQINAILSFLSKLGSCSSKFLIP